MFQLRRELIHAGTAPCPLLQVTDHQMTVPCHLHDRRVVLFYPCLLPLSQKNTHVRASSALLQSGTQDGKSNPHAVYPQWPKCQGYRISSYLP